jgi:hypothetical protein
MNSDIPMVIVDPNSLVPDFTSDRYASQYAIKYRPLLLFDGQKKGKYFYDWYKNNRYFLTRRYETMDDIWEICFMDDCEVDEFKLTPEGYLSFRDDESIRFCGDSPHSYVDLLKYCKDKARALKEK